MPNKLKFPKDFLWGTATSAHQTEGNNTNSDWWYWEQIKEDRKYPLEPSGIACDSYNRYEEDFKLCKGLNNNAVRISVEWARLEPNPGEFNKKEFEHYKKVLISARQNGLKTFVTLHHFTNPIWFANKGGWLNKKSPYYFSRYAKKCAEEFGNLVDFYTTINEPQIYSYMCYFVGVWPPNKKNIISTLFVQLNFIKAHQKAYINIKNVNKANQVGLVKHVVYYKSDFSKFNFIGYLFVKLINFLWTGLFLIPIKSKLDYIGLNYYITSKVKSLSLKKLYQTVEDMGKNTKYKGLEKILLRLSFYNLPIYITENGLPTQNETKRCGYIKDMLKQSHSAIKSGVNLKGYLYWSLLDNYEWAEGYRPKFGLVKINRKSLKRTPKESYYYYAKICKNNSI